MRSVFFRGVCAQSPSVSSALGAGVSQQNPTFISLKVLKERLVSPLRGRELASVGIYRDLYWLVQMKHSVVDSSVFGGGGEGQGGC